MLRGLEAGNHPPLVPHGVRGAQGHGQPERPHEARAFDEPARHHVQGPPAGRPGARKGGAQRRQARHGDGAARRAHRHRQDKLAARRVLGVHSERSQNARRYPGRRAAPLPGDHPAAAASQGGASRQQEPAPARERSAHRARGMRRQRSGRLAGDGGAQRSRRERGARDRHSRPRR